MTLRAFIPCVTSYGWTWGEWRGETPLAVEVLAELAELPRVLRSYSTTVATMLRMADSGDRFNITAYGTRSGRVYGRDQWLFDAVYGTYRPHGDPWVPRRFKVLQDTESEQPFERHATGVAPVVSLMSRRAPLPEDCPPMVA
ncbi:hypothetical protein [Streptomyces viridochromogenes]|uniref:hypothetical protein n=1 Tax=Streptomyces viridochromogenes TaxID=1938 RepID=UPI000AA347FB|nr:hypothetical protein [Streptomyces viridochromogenes]